MSTSDDTSEVSSSSGGELDDQGLPSASDATRGKPRIRDVSAHSRALCESETWPWQEPSLVPSTAGAIGSDSLTATSPTAPQVAAVAPAARRDAASAVDRNSAKC